MYILILSLYVSKPIEVVLILHCPLLLPNGQGTYYEVLSSILQQETGIS